MRVLLAIIGLTLGYASMNCRATVDPDGCQDGQTASCTCSGGAIATGVQTCSSGSFGACDCGSGGGGGGPTAGTLCNDPGTLVCGTGPDGGKAYALYCSPTDGTYSAVFQCPTTQSCYNVDGFTAIGCGTGSTNQFKIQYALIGKPCAAEQAAACDLDQSRVLECQQGVWIARTTCSGTSACDHAAPGTIWGNSTCPSTSVNGCIMCNNTGGGSQTCAGLAIGCSGTTCNGTNCGTDWTGHAVYCSAGTTCAYQGNRWNCCN